MAKVWTDEERKAFGEKMRAAKLAKQGVEPVVEPTVEPVAEPVSDKIVLNFRRPIEITINGIKYEGTEVSVTDIGLASEIVRIAREAFGGDILI